MFENLAKVIKMFIKARREYYNIVQIYNFENILECKSDAVHESLEQRRDITQPKGIPLNRKFPNSVSILDLHRHLPVA